MVSSHGKCQFVVDKESQMGRVSMESLWGGISIPDVEERQGSSYHGLSIMLAFGRSLFTKALVEDMKVLVSRTPDSEIGSLVLCSSSVFLVFLFSLSFVTVDETLHFSESLFIFIWK